LLGKPRRMPSMTGYALEVVDFVPMPTQDAVEAARHAAG